MNNTFSLSKDKIKILMLENIHPQAENMFRQNGYFNVETINSALTQSELIRKTQTAHIIGIRSGTLISPDILDHANKLITIGCFCIGTDQVDLKHAVGMGIPVFNAPHSNTRSVAELITGLAIILIRGIFPKSSAAHCHKWIKSAKGSNELRGKTIGIIGYGHIGSQVSILAEALGMRVIYYDIRTKLPLGNASQVENLEDLLKTSNIISLHVPEDESTINMVSNDNLTLMQDDACLINASRGRVVDIDSLAILLKHGKFRGAAIDVFPSEPGSERKNLCSP